METSKKLIIAIILISMLFNISSALPLWQLPRLNWAPPSPSPALTPMPEPPSPAPKNCPIGTMKLGACVDLLGGLVHIRIGDPVIDQCCPILGGLMGIEAAFCFCQTFTFRMLNMSVLMPVALELIQTCGMEAPPGYACPKK
ncbi:36.4 kDa proline-rich protein-like [Ipomoea triloba]|uniref:36.4 kDa proline-rich protein-like n=1 Tax=Ipomoea triloba TaxID=35885 RepID=UPI00125D9C09|nr:36.4 kDa proline-rich protein-like [Ipomoea triloba]